MTRGVEVRPSNDSFSFNMGTKVAQLLFGSVDTKAGTPFVPPDVAFFISFINAKVLSPKLSFLDSETFDARESYQ